MLGKLQITSVEIAEINVKAGLRQLFESNYDYLKRQSKPDSGALLERKRHIVARCAA
jgi:hypothetical protein